MSIRDLLFASCYLFTTESLRSVICLFITVVKWNSGSVLVINLFALESLIFAKLFYLRLSGWRKLFFWDLLSLTLVLKMFREIKKVQKYNVLQAFMMQ